MPEPETATLMMARAEHEKLREIFAMLLLFTAHQAEKCPELRARFEDIDRWCEDSERAAGDAADSPPTRRVKTYAVRSGSSTTVT